MEMTIVYPPALDWNLLFQRPQQLMVAFSKIDGVRSIFINTETVYKMEEPIVMLNDDLYLVRQGIDYDHLVKGKKVLWFSAPNQYDYSDNKPFDFIVFDYLDNSENEFATWKPYIPKCFEKADIISTTAKIMYEKHKHDGKPIFMCPNGADYEHFNKAQEKLPVPDDFPRFEDGAKIVGFHGAMASWVDYELLTKIADVGYKVVLIGNNRLFNKQITHPNIHCLPHKDYKELPYYLSQFDVGIVPFLLTDMIKGCDPIKSYEYLASGKPVIATEMEELKKYSNVMHFINHDNFEKVIKKVISSNTTRKKRLRFEVAKLNSWDARAQVAVDMIKSHMYTQKQNKGEIC